jgi:hypothetical protein
MGGGPVSFGFGKSEVFGEKCGAQGGKNVYYVFFNMWPVQFPISRHHYLELSH